MYSLGQFDGLSILIAMVISLAIYVSSHSKDEPLSFLFLNRLSKLVNLFSKLPIEVLATGILTLIFRHTF